MRDQKSSCRTTGECAPDIDSDTERATTLRDTTGENSQSLSSDFLQFFLCSQIFCFCSAAREACQNTGRDHTRPKEHSFAFPHCCSTEGESKHRPTKGPMFSRSEPLDCTGSRAAVLAGPRIQSKHQLNWDRSSVVEHTKATSKLGSPPHNGQPTTVPFSIEPLARESPATRNVAVWLTGLSRTSF